MAKMKRGAQEGAVERGRFLVGGGFLNGYTVEDTTGQLETRDDLGMWEAIHLRDRFNRGELLEAALRQDAEALATMEIPPGRFDITDEQIAELPILDPEVLS